LKVEHTLCDVTIAASNCVSALFATVVKNSPIQSGETSQEFEVSGADADPTHDEVACHAQDPAGAKLEQLSAVVSDSHAMLWVYIGLIGQLSGIPWLHTAVTLMPHGVDAPAVHWHSGLLPQVASVVRIEQSTVAGTSDNIHCP